MDPLKESKYELRVQVGTTNLIIDALPFCNEMSFINDYRNIAPEPNARFMQVNQF